MISAGFSSGVSGGWSSLSVLQAVRRRAVRALIVMRFRICM